MQRFIIVPFFLLFSCGGYYPHSGYITDGNGSNVEDGSLKIYIAKNSDSNWKNAVVKSAAAWNNASGRKLISIVESSQISNGGNYNNANVSVLTYTKNWGYEDNVLGKTIAYGYNAGNIIKSIIYINVQDFGFFFASVPSSCSTNYYDLQSVLIHEMGHALGLGESDNQSAVMGSLLTRCTIRRTVTQTDLAMLSTVL